MWRISWESEYKPIYSVGRVNWEFDLSDDVRLVPCFGSILLICGSSAIDAVLKLS